MCNRFGSLDHGLVKCDNVIVSDVNKSTQRTNMTENMAFIHGLSLMCIIDALGLSHFIGFLKMEKIGMISKMSNHVF